MWKKIVVGFAILLCVQIAVAEETPWKGEGELGITQTSGNTENQNIIAKLGLIHERALWKHEAKLEALRAEDDEKLTAERYELTWQSDYKLSETSYVFGKFRYEDDSFTGYNYQASLSAGYGYKVFDTDTDSLKLEAGIGVRTFELEDTIESEKETVDVFGLELESSGESEAIGVLGLNYMRKIGSNTEFTQDFLIEGGSENVYSKSDTGLKVNMTDKLALKLSLMIKNNSEVAADKEKTDMISAVTLVYNF